jgi:hypothetical protein
MSKIDLKIDQSRLDEEWVNQPIKHREYTEDAADARREHDEFKAELEVVKAELSRAVRSSPGEYGVEKITDKAVEAAVTVQKEHKKALQNLIDAKHRMDVMSGLVDASDQRKSALGKLVDLFLADYFSRPRASGTSKEKMDEIEKKAVRRKGRRERDNG